MFIYSPVPLLGFLLGRQQQLRLVQNAAIPVLILQYRVKSLRIFRVFHVSPHQTCSYPHFQITMSCWSLAEISANSSQRDEIKDRFELTSNWCSHIVDHACDDQSLKTITEDLQISLSTIYFTVSRNETRFDNESLHWFGCLNIIFDSLHRRLLHEVRVNFKI